MNDGKLLVEAAKRLGEIARQVDVIAARLAAKVPPGHVDYISKAAAAAWLVRVAEEARS
jgi:hypothetical protein